MGSIFALFPTDTHGWVILAASLVPVLLWLSLFLFQDRRQPEPARLILLTGGAGAGSAFLLLWIDTHWLHWASRVPQLFTGTYATPLAMALVLYLGVALMEETVKHGAMVSVVEWNAREFDQVIDGIVYGASAGLGFAFFENILYLGAATPGEFPLAVVSRALGATLGHAVFSATFGLFYARAAFASLVKRRRSAVRTILRALPAALLLHIVRTHVLTGRGVFKNVHSREELVAEGFWAAVLLHWVYNLLIVSASVVTRDYSFLVGPLLFLGLGALIKACMNPENLKLHRAALTVFTFPEWLIPTKRARDIRKFFKLSEGL